MESTTSTTTQQDTAAADAAALVERNRQAAVDAAEDAATAARIAADNAQGLADNAAAAAEKAASGGELVEVYLAGSVGIRRAGGGVTHYGPGNVKVPQNVADALKSSPTFATSGNPLVDAQVRRTLERQGVVELATQEETTARASSGGESDEDREGPPSGEGGTSRKAQRVQGTRTTEPLTTSELAALGADEVTTRYERAVKQGRVRPIADGKGSGSEGNVVKADMVAALHAAGEK